ncbi:MAG: electron transport complex subunit E [Candidatus Euphemobacter frigidus]|nr:electron transport complex subunit E [Candidatus Euphemobacter frigidus]MDP8274976.1 electron transport complex subunit E [Candidatus Euphemobacter frigidus]
MLKEFTKGIFKRNPVFILLLGLCPTLAVSISVENAIGMGVASTFVLVFSNVIVSLIRSLVPKKIRIPCFIVVIATFVTLVELFLEAYLPGLNKSLGLFVPLIVVNCIILGRAEAFASRNPVLLSLSDGLGMGVGFTGALVLLGAIREVLGANALFGFELVPGFRPAMIMILPPGAFLTIGLLLGLFALIRARREARGAE